MRLAAFLGVLLFPTFAFAQKDAAVASADTHADALWPTALKIWDAAEPPLAPIAAYLSLDEALALLCAGEGRA